MRVLFVLLSLLFSLSAEVSAESYPLPAAGNQLVGEIQYVEIRAEETLLDIARRYNLGYNEITAANPGVDPWLPREGTSIQLPTRFVLPAKPWEGVVVNISEMRLYYFPPPQNGETPKVITHPIGIGREGRATPVGKFQVMMKIENPNWTMPVDVHADLQAEGIHKARLVPPGPDNPLGDYAMMLNSDGIFIHGTNKPYSIGMRVSLGCLRLYPEDINQLVWLVPKGTAVRIIDEPYKFGKENGVLFMEAHAPIPRDGAEAVTNLTPVVAAVVESEVGTLYPAQWDYIIALAARHTGVPIPITRRTVAMTK